jgi:hypothetical protein
LGRIRETPLTRHRTAFRDGPAPGQSDPGRRAGTISAPAGIEAATGTPSTVRLACATRRSVSQLQRVLDRFQAKPEIPVGLHQAVSIGLVAVRHVKNS